MEVILSIITTILSATILFVAKKTAGEVKKIQTEHQALLESQRNQLKASIVRSYEEALRNGFITHLELETMMRRAESYSKLGGNTYVETIVEHAKSFDIKGQPIPEYEHKE